MIRTFKHSNQRRPCGVTHGHPYRAAAAPHVYLSGDMRGELPGVTRRAAVVVACHQGSLQSGGRLVAVGDASGTVALLEVRHI